MNIVACIPTKMGLATAESDVRTCSSCQQNCWFSKATQRDLGSLSFTIMCLECMVKEMKNSREEVKVAPPGDETIASVAEKLGQKPEDIKKTVMAIQSSMEIEINSHKFN